LLKIIILLLLSINIFANDIFELYRTKGINAVEQKLKESLKDISTWEKYLENKNVDFGFYETKEYVLITQKDNKQISLYKKDKDDFKEISKDSIIIGEKYGDKAISGDKRTPEGAYELLQKRTGLDQFYGPFALTSNYPDNFDKSLNKTGHGIWIHGMPLNGDRDKFTQGCIALENDRLEALENNIDYKKTVLITTNTQFQKATKSEIALILSTIYKWKDAWKYSKIDEYLSYYSKDFKRPNRSDFKIFESQKRSVFSKNENKTINLFNIDISPYPNSVGKRIYKVLMDEEYFSPSTKFIGKKELFLEIIDNKVQILTED